MKSNVPDSLFPPGFGQASPDLPVPPGFGETMFTSVATSSASDTSGFQHVRHQFHQHHFQQRIDRRVDRFQRLRCQNSLLRGEHLEAIR